MFAFFDILFTNPTTNLLVAFYKLFTVIGVPFAFGFSIIALTVAIRLILAPFVAQQIKSAHKMQRVAPHVAAVKEKHKGDNKRQQEEIMKLYREHGVNPAAGCLPLLIQLPITIGLYNVLRTAVSANASTLSHINNVLYFDFLKLQHVWNTVFFGLPLAETPSKLFAHNPLMILVPVLTGLFQFILSKMMMPEEVLAAESAIAKKTETKTDDFQVAFQKQSMFLFPAMIGFFSFSLPLGLSLYWNTFTIFGILQQYFLIGPGAAAPWFEKVNIRKKSKI